MVFDRGVPDCVAYAVLMGTDPTAGRAACERYRYHPEVLVVEPWEEIYVTDAERTMSFADTIPFHAALVDAYERAGYSLVEVPRDSAENRAAFVRDLRRRPLKPERVSGGERPQGVPDSGERGEARDDAHPAQPPAPRADGRHRAREAHSQLDHIDDRVVHRVEP